MEASLASDRSSPWAPASGCPYTNGSAYSCNASSLDQALSCFPVPPRLADPCGPRVHCTALNSPTPPHDQLTCALHTRRGATHSPLQRFFMEASLASDRSSPWAPASGCPYANGSAYSCNASSLDQALSCFPVPPQLADPCGPRVHCTALNSPTPPHDQLTCALHTHRGATHSPLQRFFMEASLASDRSSPWAPASGCPLRQWLCLLL